MPVLVQIWETHSDQRLFASGTDEKGPCPAHGEFSFDGYPARDIKSRCDIDFDNQVEIETFDIKEVMIWLIYWGL